ncbi:FAD:protein FMN transferase [Agrobacterium fabrum]|uniref:FAD:protein FMN transferase n=1 Tax=Agrobacterium fabrum TaxID=1176649 RepID=UPI003BA05B15
MNDRQDNGCGNNRPGRRRFIKLMAAFAGLPLLPGKGAAGESPVIWRGQALGAPATLVLNHESRVDAERLLRRVVAEVARLEDIFSLFHDGSALAELNRTGVLAVPPPEMVELLELCRRFHELAEGAFDPTIQPLWLLHARHFSRDGADPAGPSATEMCKALALVGFDSVHFDRNRISLPQRGMALTLNGIAQGYVTDRIVALLRDAGVTSSLVDMGENRAIGANAQGVPWRIGLAQSEDATRPDMVLDITDRAVATSAGAGFHFDSAGRFSHILDPRTGLTASRYARVSAVADDAATADALSTAFSLMDELRIETLRASLKNVEVYLQA